MSPTGKRRLHNQRLTPARGALLGSALIAGAMLSAVALRAPGLHWLAWISLLPLFQAIRTLRSPIAAITGGLWGISLFGFAAIGPSPVIASTFLSGILLTAIPALYCGGGSLVTRWIGFNPFLLGLGWIGVELALKPLGLPLGLLAGAGAQGDSLFIQWGGRLLGYVFIAFAVACFNASLIALLSRARWPIPSTRLLTDRPRPAAHLSFQPVFALQRFTLRESFPRAPPL